MLLGPLAEPLAEAGLHRVNVSCDSLRPERFAGIRHRGDLPTVLRSMELAEAAGLRPLKVNVVLIRGRNDDEIGDFAAFARRTGRTVRFIEFMPLDAQGRWSRSALVPGQEVLDRIGAEWSLEPVPPAPGTGGADAGVGVDEGHAPAERFRFADGRGEIGIISTVSQPFCGSCNRLRVTAEGNLRNCLFSDAEVNVRDAMRQGCSDATLAALFRRAVWDKLPGHGINEPGFLRPRRSMSMIGG
jgi:cyclic pyranopterin phosphate synthase